MIVILYCFDRPDTHSDAILGNHLLDLVLESVTDSYLEGTFSNIRIVADPDMLFDSLPKCDKINQMVKDMLPSFRTK